ncbi:(2Fe-2S)-binding protein [Streptosporangium sp. NPDC002544]|uniref:(2Fe-2S)-binding protein n=1 Tax=Streptosporangium sp. NPDC002544 TaxID=3154538 RepID=UPI0033311FBA
MESASTESILTALGAVAGFGSFFSLHIGGDPAGWHDVKSDYERGFAGLVEATAARYGTRELRIGASITQLGHAARLWSPLLGTVLTHAVVPDLTRLDRADDGPRLRLPTPAGWHYESPSQLYDLVIRHHLEPLAAGLRVKVAPGLLYGNAASALAEAGRAIAVTRPDLAEPATDLVADLLARGHLARKGALISPELAFRRTTCCLYYRVPGGSKCDDCALVEK